MLVMLVILAVLVVLLALAAQGRAWLWSRRLLLHGSYQDFDNGDDAGGSDGGSAAVCEHRPVSRG